MNLTPKMVSAAIIIADGKVLLTRRGAGGSLPGKWEFPGGKVDPGETVQTCLERELKEELNIETRSENVLGESHYEYAHGSFTIYAVRSKIVSGDISLSVHDRFKWVSFDRLLEYDLAPADIPLAKIIQEKKHEL